MSDFVLTSPEAIIAGIGMVGSGGVAWGVASAKNAARDAKHSLLKQDFDKHIDKDESFHSITTDRLGRIETQVERLERIENKLDSLLSR